jgi:acyl carrier protein
MQHVSSAVIDDCEERPVVLELEAVESSIKEIAIEVLELPVAPGDIDATEEGFLERYGFNSIDALELLLQVERAFNVEVRDEDLDANLIRSVRSLAEYVVMISQESA